MVDGVYFIVFYGWLLVGLDYVDGYFGFWIMFVVVVFSIDVGENVFCFFMRFYIKWVDYIGLFCRIIVWFDDRNFCGKFCCYNELS